MKKCLRYLALAVGALATILSPCAPALALPAPCAMPGCEDGPAGLVSPAPCCCAPVGAPAEAGGAAALIAPPAKAAAAWPAAGVDGPTWFCAPVWDVASEPPTPVPLFILHAALLI